MKDILKPLKNLLPDYQALKRTAELAILANSGIRWPLDPSIKAADLVMLSTEGAT